MVQFTRQQVVEEIDRARAAEESSMPIDEGKPYPTTEDIYPQLTYKDTTDANLANLNLKGAVLNHLYLRKDAPLEVVIKK